MVLGKLKKEENKKNMDKKRTRNKKGSKGIELRRKKRR